MSIEVLVPALNKRYDFLIPSVMKVDLATELISKAIQEYEEDVSFDSNSLMLCSKAKGNILKGDTSIEKAGIRDGSEVILI